MSELGSTLMLDTGDVYPCATCKKHHVFGTPCVDQRLPGTPQSETHGRQAVKRWAQPRAVPSRPPMLRDGPREETDTLRSDILAALRKESARLAHVNNDSNDIRQELIDRYIMRLETSRPGDVVLEITVPMKWPLRL